MNRSRSLLTTLLSPVCAFKPGLACFRARHIRHRSLFLSEERTAIDGKSPLFPAFSPRRGLLPSLKVILLRASFS